MSESGEQRLRQAVRRIAGAFSTAPPDDCPPDPLKIFEVLTKHYDTEELHTLCFFIGVDFESLQGDRHYAKARALVELFKRREELDELQAAIHQQRPDIPWPR